MAEDVWSSTLPTQSAFVWLLILIARFVQIMSFYYSCYY